MQVSTKVQGVHTISAILLLASYYGLAWVWFTHSEAVSYTQRV